jgi:hypothetical protein
MRGPALSVSIAAAALAFAPTIASAEEPLAAREPRLLRETAEVTSVVDAFDDDDPFDLHLSLGYSHRFKTAAVRRETNLTEPGLSSGGYVASNENIARFNQQVSTLDVQAHAGLYKDLALTFRLPVILSDTRELTSLEGSERVPSRYADPSGAQLFTLPLTSPRRSGIDFFAVALNYAIFNQQRDPSKATWVVGVEGRFGVGQALHACRERPEAGVAVCPDPVNPSQNRGPGISRAMNTFVVQTIFSKRFGYVEPYAGFSFLAEFPQARGDFAATSDLRGMLLNRPPLQGTITGGVEVIPWENREQFQRLVFDFRGRGTYISPGRDYTELFDALGSSQAPSLRTPNPGAYGQSSSDPTRSIADPRVPPVYFTGITDVQAHMAFGGSASITWQAGEFVKLTGGLGLSFVQSHVVTAADACNPDFRTDAGASGPCRTTVGTRQSVTGIPNPNHRPVIDLPGRRFTVDDTRIVDLWLMGTVMF